MNLALAKGLAIGMGVLILIAMAVVVYGLASGGLKEERPAGFGARELPVPAGCRVAELAPAGDFLALRLDGPAARGCGRVLLVDPGSGAVHGSLAPPPLD